VRVTRATTKRADGQCTSPLERPCEHEIPAQFLELRVAPVRSAGSPVAGMDWRQKIKHRCNETKTFYVSTRSQKCLLRRRGAWRPCRNVKPVRVDRLSHLCERYRPFLVRCKVRTRWISEDLQQGRHRAIPFRDCSREPPCSRFVEQFGVRFVSRNGPRRERERRLYGVCGAGFGFAGGRDRGRRRAS
jgi:hypothetical protein